MTEPTRNPLRVFLLEDNPADVHVIRESLRRSGLSVQLTTAARGDEALSFLQPSTGLEPPRVDAVIVDLNVPGRDGVEILKNIRRCPEFQEVPILVLTGKAEIPEIVNELASSVIRKPADLQGFLEVGHLIRNALARKGTRDPL